MPESNEGGYIKHDQEKLKTTLQRGAEALYFSHCKSDETWLPLIEKAYAKAHGDYYAIDGGFPSEGIEDLTGGVGVVINPEDIMDKELFWREQLSQVNEKYLFGGGSKSTSVKGFVSNHAYAVLRTWEEGDLKLLKLRNPWGEVEWEGDWSDGSKLWTPEMMLKLGHTFGDDGVFWISYKDFLKHFPAINRVRLFTKEWQIAQQWTSVNVPWTVDYLDTKFQFTTSKKCPVVIVLTQPDDRYYLGLRGRYLYSMHFRVYKEGEEDQWIVRSMHNSGNETVFTRSVSAEIADLEPGTYNVVFKVTTYRSTSSSTAEDCILKYATDRKEKLLHVGRRYDYAMAKGNLRGLEKVNRKRSRDEVMQIHWSSLKLERKINQKEKEKARKRKKRIDDAMRERRKAFLIKQRESARSQRQRMVERREHESTQAQDDSGTLGKSESKVESSTQSKAETTPSSEAEQEKAKAEAGKVDEEPVVVGTEVETKDGHSGDASKSSEDAQPVEKVETLSKDLSKLEIQGSSRSRVSIPGSVSPLDEGYESPLEPPEELDDDDFEWDSEM